MLVIATRLIYGPVQSWEIGEDDLNVTSLLLHEWYIAYFGLKTSRCFWGVLFEQPQWCFPFALLNGNWGRTAHLSLAFAQLLWYMTKCSCKNDSVELNVVKALLYALNKTIKELKCALSLTSMHNNLNCHDAFKICLLFSHYGSVQI